MSNEKSIDNVHIIYPYRLPKNAYNDGWELRYSLRSLEKNLNFNFDVTIIGDIPKWINKENTICIQLNNHNIQAQRQTKINQKILKATELYENFVVMNDDIIIMNKIDFEQFCMPREMEKKLSENMIDKVGKNTFAAQMANSIKKMKDAEFTQYLKNYVTHTPHYYETNIIKEIQEKIDLAPLSNPSIVFENVYFNYLNINGELAKKTRYGVWNRTNNKYDGEDIFNFDEYGDRLNNWLKPFVENKFQQKSKYEI